jgi:hypothetical protein
VTTTDTAPSRINPAASAEAIRTHRGGEDRAAVPSGTTRRRRREKDKKRWRGGRMLGPATAIVLGDGGHILCGALPMMTCI